MTESAPSTRLERARLAERAPAPTSTLERPGDAAHGDYATNVALQLAAGRAAAAARDRGGARGTRTRARRRSSGRRSPGPGFVNLWRRPGVVRRGARRDPRRGRRATAPARPRRRSACRSRWCPRTRPARSPSPPRGTAPTATASRGCSSSPATTSSASTTTTTPAPRWSASARRSRRRGAGRSRPRTATTAPTSPSWRARPDDPVPQMLHADRGDAGALPDPLRQLGAAERARAAAARVPAAARHVREGRRALGALVRATATRRTAS